MQNSKEYIKGKILYKTEWEGQAPDMPPTKIEDRVLLYKKRNQFRPLIPTNIQDLDHIKICSDAKDIKNENNLNLTNDLKALNFNKDSNNTIKFVKPDYPYDVNDPRNILVFEKIKKLKTELLLKYLYKEYMLPYYDFDSIRQLILQKRVEKNSLKSIKIPILEKQIENDENLQNLMKNLLKEKENFTKEELDKKIKIQLELLNKNNSGLILSDQEFYSFINEKVKTLRKDVVNKVQYSYFQIIHEFYYATDIWKIFFRLLNDVCEQDRRLKPKRRKKEDKLVEKCSLIKIHVHVIKAYNIPIREDSKPYSYIEKTRDAVLKQIYRRAAGTRRTTGLNFDIRNMFGRKTNMTNKSLSNISFPQFGLNNMMNPNIPPGIGMNMVPPLQGIGMNNINMPIGGNLSAPGFNSNPNMQGFLPNNNLGPNNFNNNSQLFNNAYTANNSFNDVNLNVGQPGGGFNNMNNMMNNSLNRFGQQNLQNDFNNLNVPFGNNNNLGQNLQNQSAGRFTNPNQMFNPNLNNVMGNPNLPGFIPAYNLPNSYMKNEPKQDDFVMDGDIIRMVEQLRSMERNVQSFVEVKLVYYDQKSNLRTDSLDGVHPDYNYKMQFEIKPTDEAEFFSKEELHRSNGGLYFTLYDEVRNEDIIEEKDGNTYIYRYEKKYLGSLFLPFTTIFQNSSQLETVSKINVPMTVFGYYSDTSTAFDVQSKKEEDMRNKSNLAQMNPGNLNPNNNASQNSFFAQYKEGK